MSVFFPLQLGGKETAEWMQKNNIKMVYGETKDTFGRAINGYPMFQVVGFLNEEDTKKVWEKHDQIKAALENI
jgi:hypothetical protein